MSVRLAENRKFWTEVQCVVLQGRGRKSPNDLIVVLLAEWLILAAILTFQLFSRVLFSRLFGRPLA